MIELIRFFLAGVVAKTHLWPTNDVWLGPQAVFAFYTLSGYLMTRVLNETYGFSFRGFRSFALNRFLRLWPAYIVVCLLTLLIAAFVPIFNDSGTLRLPRTWVEIVTNITIFGQVGFDFQWSNQLPRLAVTSWSLSIELVSYFLLAIYFGKSRVRLCVLASIGIVSMAISTATCVVSENPAAYGPYCYQNRYGVVQAGFLPFAAGGLLYFHAARFSAWLRQRPQGVLVVLCIVEIACIPFEFLRINAAPFVGSAIMLWAIVTIPSAAPGKFTDFFGRASYHLFIAHLSIAATLIQLQLAPNVSFRLFGATLVVSLAISFFIVPLEKRINVIRGLVSRSALAKRQQFAGGDLG